jgi:hypothetical protein
LLNFAAAAAEVKSRAAAANPRFQPKSKRLHRKDAKNAEKKPDIHLLRFMDTE